jgi:hypothetical protein
MRTTRRVLTTAVVAIGVLLGIVVIREAFFSLTAYFVVVPGARLFSDGKPLAGWLHRGGKGQLLILTRNVAGKRESYWISVPGERKGWVSGCGEWSAPRFPLVPIFDVNPPCVVWAAAPVQATPLKRAPVFGPRFVEFTSDDGGRLKAVW